MNYIASSYRQTFISSAMDITITISIVFESW